MTSDLTLLGNLASAHSFEAAVLMSRIAEAGDIDELGHVNNAVYLVWAQDAGTAHWRAVATPRMQEDMIWVALRHEIDYRDQVLEGETVEIRTWLGRVSGPRFVRHIDIRKPGAKRFSAKVKTDWCLIDSKTRKPKRVGRDILDLFGFEGSSRRE